MRRRAPLEVTRSLRPYRHEEDLAKLILDRLTGPDRDHLRERIDAGKAGLRDVFVFLGMAQP